MLRYFAPHCLIRLKKTIYQQKRNTLPVKFLSQSYQVRIKFEVCKTTVSGQQTFELKIEN